MCEHIQKESDKKHYCLTVSDLALLRNGYIYIKELLVHKINCNINHKIHEH